jgi:hypothetical protein
MGFFSWKTSDTNRSIANQYSGRETFVVHMILEDGRVFTEEEYEGYGVFGGKDIYELIAEMNGLCLDGDTDQKRGAAIDLLHKTIITNGERSYTNGVDFTNWEQPIEAEGGKTANLLVSEGWKQVYPNGYGDFNIAAKNGIKIPKLVEDLPEDFNDVSYPKNCDFQGYFYNDEEDDDEEEEEEEEDEDDENEDEDDED